MTLDDMDEVLARLESGPVAGPARLAWEPTTPLEAVRAWAQARGMKRGAHPTPQVKLLALDYQRHAKEAGWALDWLPLARIGLELGRLGLTRCSSHGKRSYLVDEASAKALWLACPSKPRVRRPPRKHLVKHRRPESFFPLKASRGMPVVNTLGRVYPSARRAAALLRTSRDSLQRAARHGEGCNGLLWRYLTPEEVRCIPPTALVGDAIPWLAWNRVVSVHCPHCGVASTHDGRASNLEHPPATLPPGSPTGVASAGGGSPTHIP